MTTESPRTKRISELIDAGVKCSINVSAKTLYGCDVCWTCKFFNALTSIDIAPGHFGDKASGIVE